MFVIIVSGLILVGCNPLLNFGVVVKGKLYRSGQPDREDLKFVHRKLKIQTIINLTEYVKGFERGFAFKNGIQVIHIPMNADNPPTQVELETYVKILLDSKNYPIGIHCQGGADRTGIMVAIYRLEFQHWTKDDAYFEMLSYLHVPPAHPRLSEYLYGYGRWAQDDFLSSSTSF